MITIHQNTTFKRSWRLQALDGTPIDVTDALCEMMILDSYDLRNVKLHSTSAENGHISITADEGLFVCTVPAEDFTLACGDYVGFCCVTFDPLTAPRVKVLEDFMLYVLPHPHLHELPSEEEIPK